MDERAKLLAEYFERRKKQLAKERAVAIRNNPPTKTQLRRLMMTYLKNMGMFTYSQLNKKSFEDIQGLYMKEQELIADFVPIGSEEDENIEYMDTEEALNEGRQSTVDTTGTYVSTARLDFSTASQELSTVGPRTTPTTSKIFDNKEITLVDALIKLKDDKVKGVAFKDSESTNRPARSILTLKPLLTINPKDKGKGVLEEPESAKKMTKSNFDAAQIDRDEEIARQLEVELQVELEKER
nr:hypothetical protein [Tanacetum cinerariifolium]